MNSKNILFYKNFLFILDNNSYKPKYDSFFLEENIILENGETALDIGTGIGFHAVSMGKKASKVVAVDVNQKSVKFANVNILINGVEDIVEVRHGHFLETVKSEEKFDLIITNPPQMPTPFDKLRDDWYGYANFGGTDGRAILDLIIQNANKCLKEGGRLQILHPMYSNIPKTIEMLESLDFDVEITAEKYFPVGNLSFKRASYLTEIGFPFIERNGKLMQYFAVITARK